MVETFADPDGVDIPVHDRDGQIVFCPNGDLHCDGQKNSIDALFILQKEVELKGCEDMCPSSGDAWIYCPECDINQDGHCDVLDSRFILQCEVGIPNEVCPDHGS